MTKDKLDILESTIEQQAKQIGSLSEELETLRDEIKRIKDRILKMGRRL